MDELKNLLLSEFRFNQEPNATNFQMLQQDMYAYQTARFSVKLDAKPIELRINKHTTPRTYYTVTVVWPGVGNAVNDTKCHAAYTEANGWCQATYPGVPIIRGY